ncbi:hypothetical protein [uncultured Litoreibacter sp.]|uniref:hypothetical protein n=1 Tax=uncultured Litoreibacter sp. TaxID=1392394 RepID=UPI00262C1B23|nr:hypothetical protein [uncultured Litoreibacter sp.]
MSMPKQMVGFWIQDAAIVDFETLAFACSVSPDHPEAENQITPGRLLSFNMTTGEWGYMTYSPFDSPKVVGGQIAGAAKEALFVSGAGHVAKFGYAKGESGLEPDNIFGARGSTRALAYIDGAYYSGGGDARLSRRTETGAWETLHRLGHSLDNPRFWYMVGQSQDLIYLAGPKGVHLWDGQNLIKQVMPDAVMNRDMFAPFHPIGMAQAPDGRVFIAGRDGDLVVGDATSGWAPVVEAKHAGPHAPKKIAWFNGALWGLNATSTVELGDVGWHPRAFPQDKNRPVFHTHLASGHGWFLVCGYQDAAIFDGTRWYRLFGSEASDE